MLYYDTLNKKRYDELSRSFALFSPYPLDSTQLKHSDLVTRDIISHYNNNSLIDDNDISFDKLIADTMNFFSTQGIGFVHVGGAVNSILSSVKYKKHLSMYDFDFSVISDIAFNGDSYYKVPNSIILPDYFSLSSVHFLEHEISHILKEFNPLECRGVYTDEEVIPIALELISSFESNDFGVFKKREYLMRDTALLYIKLTKDKKYISKDDIVGFTSCYRKCIMYLNSFYYAMKLFSLYLEDKETTLEYIEMVLTGSCTTKRLIDVLFTEDDYLYNIGISEFRNLIK